MLARSVYNRVYRYRTPILVVIACLLVEIVIHVRAYHVSRPSAPLDPPFNIGCLEPPAGYGPQDRQNATIVMLARNAERDQAVASVTSLERQFNRWFHYPIVFLTGESRGWDKTFIRELSKVVTGEVRFETIDASVWGHPEWTDREQAAQATTRQESMGVKYGGLEDYHHMCRWYSGHFYDHKALKDYKWYWRVEPGVEFTCAITYDPFLAMAQNNKTYGYTIALWEVPDTAASLFATISDHKSKQEIPTTDLWRSMVQPSWAPFFLRRFMPSKVLRDSHGDVWNLCHYWGNFEIADMDFFRRPAYRAYFDTLDLAGGFYYERWGDAPVRSLGAALYLEPRQLHHFADFGYQHPPFQSCPKNAAGKQLGSSNALPRTEWTAEYKEGSGCRCDCDPFGFTNRPICLNHLRQGVQ